MAGRDLIEFGDRSFTVLGPRFRIITSWRDGEDDDGDDDDDDDVSEDDVNTDSDDGDGDEGDDGDGDRSFTVLGSHCHQVWANHLMPRENMLR